MDMRRVAWILVVLGGLLVLVSPLYAHVESQRLLQAWLDDDRHEPRCLTAAECDRAVARAAQKVRLLSQQLRPAWTVASPWPCAAAGGGVAAFGVLLLAIRRPSAGARVSAG